ncbi:MAG: ATP-grasp domain-containing protein [Oligoflexia bacterium]|nr:ATP-grasp domain-containing protein [Oligoflexia bacterium]
MGSRFLVPPEESLNIAQDKAQTLAVAEGLNLPCPRTWRPENAQQFADLATQLAASKDLNFVVKPRSGCGSAGVVYGNETGPAAQSQFWRQLLPQYWIEHWDRFGPMLVQERIPAEGRGQGVSLLFDSRAECIAAFAHERIEQYPNSGGPSTDRMSIHAQEITEWSIALLKKLKWKGIGMVEWKLDPRDGTPRLMEINPRFWGSLELAVRAGIDFPALYARAAAEEKLEPRVQYPAGVRCRWMIPGELLRYVSQSRGKRESLVRFVRGLPASAEEWDLRDLRGFFAVVLCTAAYAFNPKYWKYLR